MARGVQRALLYSFFLSSVQAIIIKGNGSLRRPRPRRIATKKAAPSASLLRRRANQTGTESEELFSGVWHEQEQSEWESLCGYGRLLPQVYLLGAPKSSTTTLAHELMHAGVQCMHNLDSDKEFHFFDGQMNWHSKGEWEVNRQKLQWLGWFPTCPNYVNTSVRRQLLADFTPDYMRMVDLPAGIDQYGTFPPWDGPALGSQVAGANHTVSLPPMLKRFYGVESSRRLRFIVLLRDPLARMQSAWYHAQSFDFMNECVDCRASSFQNSLYTHLEKWSAEPRQYSDWLWTGMYGQHMVEWLKVFDPWQFFVIPYNYMMEGDKDNICRQLSKHLNFKIGCDSKGAPLSHEWSHEHPPIEEDLTPQIQQRFNSMIAWNTNLLIDQLVKINRRGAVLANYDGPEDDREAITEWLTAGW